MKILILTNFDVGLYKFRRELIERLIERGNEVAVSLPEGRYTADLIKLGCTFFDTEVDRRGTNPVKDLRLLKHYWSIIRRYKPNVVLTYTIKPNVYGGIAARLNKAPYIANVTGLGSSIENAGMLQKFAMYLYKVGVGRASCVFFQNKPNYELFKRSILGSKAHARVIPGSGVNLAEHGYEPYPSESGGLRFLFVGRIMKDKGVDELFEAARKIKLAYSDVTFLLVGDCDKNYEQKLERLKAEGVIEPLGFQKDVRSFIKNSHCTILPSYHEGTANVLLESAACGRPVIATNVTGCLETFDDGVTGLGCEARSAADLADQIERFIAMPEAEHRAMGEAGRAKMEREFNREIIVNAYIEEIKNSVQAMND